MIATVNTSGTLADGRYYDAWGNVIGSGSATGEPKGRYCANLGHVQDDESGLIYMRARYYEPTTGRFVSEDSSRNGRNWFGYCDSNPVNNIDASGKISDDLRLAWQAIKDAIKPLLVGLGGLRLFQYVTLLVTIGYGDGLFAISQMLFGVGQSLERIGEVAASSSNAWARIGGAICGYAGAQACAAGIMLLYMSEYIIGLGAGIGEWSMQENPLWSSGAGGGNTLGQ